MTWYSDIFLDFTCTSHHIVYLMLHMMGARVLFLSGWQAVCEEGEGRKGTTTNFRATKFQF